MMFAMWIQTLYFRSTTCDRDLSYVAWLTYHVKAVFWEFYSSNVQVDPGFCFSHQVACYISRFIFWIFIFSYRRYPYLSYKKLRLKVRFHSDRWAWKIWSQQSRWCNVKETAKNGFECTKFLFFGKNVVLDSHHELIVWECKQEFLKR